MRNIALLLSVASVLLTGCHKEGPPPAPEAAPYAGRSLADLRAEYARSRSQYEADCLRGTPEHIESTRTLCAHEREQMAPLGNEIARREQIEAQQH